MIINPIYVKKGDDMPDNSYRVIDRVNTEYHTQAGESGQRSVGFLRIGDNNKYDYEAAMTQSVSCAGCRIVFNLKQTTTVNIDHDFPSYDYDYTAISKIDTEFEINCSASQNENLVYKKFATNAEPVDGTLSIEIPSGRHFIEIYCYMGQGVAGASNWKFKITNEDLQELYPEISPENWHLGLNARVSSVESGMTFIGSGGGIYKGTLRHNIDITTQPSIYEDEKIWIHATCGGSSADILPRTLDGNFTKDNIRSGKTLLGVTGTYTGSTTEVVKKTEPTITLHTSNTNPYLYISGETTTGTYYYLNGTNGDGDSNLQAGNIAKGANIFGIDGKYTGTSTSHSPSLEVDTSYSPWHFTAKCGGSSSSTDAKSIAESKGDTDVASKIVKGQSVFGIDGEYVGGAGGGSLEFKHIASQISTSYSSSLTFYLKEENNEEYDIYMAYRFDPTTNENLTNYFLITQLIDSNNSDIGLRGIMGFLPQTYQSPYEVPIQEPEIAGTPVGWLLPEQYDKKLFTYNSNQSTVTLNLNAIYNSILPNNRRYNLRLQGSYKLYGLKVSGSSSAGGGTITKDTIDFRLYPDSLKPFVRATSSTSNTNDFYLVNADSDLTADNIKKDTNIFGIQGTYGATDSTLLATVTVSGTNNHILNFSSTKNCNNLMIIRKSYSSDYYDYNNLVVEKMTVLDNMGTVIGKWQDNDTIRTTILDNAVSNEKFITITRNSSNYNYEINCSTCTIDGMQFGDKLIANKALKFNGTYEIYGIPSSTLVPTYSYISGDVH